MKDTEYDMLEALRDWFYVERAQKNGIVSKNMTDLAILNLYNTCITHCDEHEGEFPLSDPD